jgi:demethylmenaquinone methyltransferase/2-methoxy-6-polyprenyl-1,4-benzoquinol methylase
MGFDAHSYERVAFVYDALAGLYSFGRIEASKQIQIESIVPGERVLFAGVGRGREAIRAARRGAVVTAVDLSSRMLGHFARGIVREGLAADSIEGDVADHDPSVLYDTVFAHYFLNLFDADAAPAMLAILAQKVRPGGRLILADFAPACGGRVAGCVTEAYYRPVNWIAWALGFCALHSIPDYPKLIEGVGARVESITRFPLIPGLADPAYQSIVARRPG